MVIAFQVVLIIILLVSFMGAVGEKKDLDLRRNMASICIAGMGAFIVSVIWL